MSAPVPADATPTPTPTPTPIPTPSLTTSDGADPAAPVVGQAMRFAVVGTLSTGLHFVIFSLLDLWWGNAQAANIAALVLSTVANTAAKRSWTFGVTGREGVARHQLQGFVLFLITWAATAGGLAVLHQIRPNAGTLLNLVALTIATGISMVLRFLAMRYWVFKAA